MNGLQGALKGSPGFSIQYCLSVLFRVLAVSALRDNDVSAATDFGNHFRSRVFGITFSVCDIIRWGRARACCSQE